MEDRIAALESIIDELVKETMELARALEDAEERIDVLEGGLDEIEADVGMALDKLGLIP